MSALTERSADLVNQAQRFDDETLEHLTSRGLVRRARKLVGTEPRCAEEHDFLQVALGDATVAFAWSEPLTQATCRCATAGVCQHVLAAIMFLRDRTAEPSISADTPAGSATADATAGSEIEAAIAALTGLDLDTWARTTDRRWADERLASLDPSSVTISTGTNLSVQLPPPHGHVRFLGESLDDAIVKPSGRHDRRIVALAVLTVWQAAGREAAPVVASSARPTELVAERRAVSGRATRVASDLINIGLLHVGDGERERLDTLASSARGVKLYRLARLAETAADQVDALIARSTEADTGILLERLAEIAVVAEAIETRLAQGDVLPDGLLGSARSRYESVGQLELQGLGHYSWGDQRFAGTTAVFAQRHDRIYSATRPRIANGRPLASTPGWTGIGSFEALTGRHVTLTNALANPDLRLSGTDRTSATPRGSVTADDLSRLAWTGDTPRTASRLLGRVMPPWVVLSVDDEVRPVGFDPVTQRTEWTIRAAAQPIVVGLSFRASAAMTSATFEQIAASAEPDFVVGRLRMSHERLDLWPISMMVDGRLVNLADGGDQAPHPIEASTPPGALALDDGRPLDRLSAQLVAAADGGQRPSRQGRIEALATTAESWGLPVLATTIRNAPTPSVALLRACWVEQTIRDLDAESVVAR